MATLGLNIYSGDFTSADAPELATQIGAAIALQLLFKTPGYTIAEVKTVLKVKLPEAATNLKNGNSVKPSRNQLWKQAEATDNADLKGTLMHAELADLMRAQKMSKVRDIRGGSHRGRRSLVAGRLCAGPDCQAHRLHRKKPQCGETGRRLRESSVPL